MTQSPLHRRRWFEAADFRHATFGPPVATGDEMTTLCDRTAVAVTPEPGRYAPQCPACDRAWRAAEGIPQAVVTERSIGRVAGHD
jgi:zinc finger protein